MLIRAMTIEDYEQCMKLRARIPELGVHPDFDTRERIHMAVSREHRGLGLARGRIERSMTELRRGGIVDAFLFTHYGNPAAGPSGSTMAGGLSPGSRTTTVSCRPNDHRPYSHKSLTTPPFLCDTYQKPSGGKGPPID